MKKYFIVLIILLGLFSFIYIFITNEKNNTLAENDPTFNLSQTSDLNSEPSKEHINVEEKYESEEIKSNSTKTDNEFLFVLKTNNGKLALFDATGVLKDEYDVYVESLPSADIEELKKGINIYSEKQLNDLIMDFTS